METLFQGETNISTYLLENLGPRRKDLVSVVILTVVYALIFLSGLIGNVCTCVVIARNSCMQTTTNYYLFSLAMSDLLLLSFGLPPELYSIWEAYPWRLGEAFCYLRQTFLELTSYASVLTITAFTVERYVAICKPLLSHKMAVLSRAVKIIVCIWIISLVVALPYAVHTRLYHALKWPVNSDQPLADSLVCSIPEMWRSGHMRYIFQVSTFLFFLAPVTLIICLYIMIGVALRKSPLSRGSSDERSQGTLKQAPLPYQPRRVVVRMLVAVTVAFIICWAPFHAQRLMVLYVHRWTPELMAVQSNLFYISGVLYFVSSTMNPILYNVISHRYRAAFRQTIFGSFRQCQLDGRPRLSSNTSYRQTSHKDLNSSCQHQSLLLHRSPAVSHRPPSHSQHSASNRRTVSWDSDVAASKVAAQYTDSVGTALCSDMNILTCSRLEPNLCDPENNSCKKERGAKDSCLALKDTLHKRTSPDTASAKQTGANYLYINNFLNGCGVKSDKTNKVPSSDVAASNGYGPMTRCLLGDALESQRVTSHLQCADNSLGSRDGALCRQCLTHASRGNSPHNGADAYHVTFDAKEPRTIV